MRIQHAPLYDMNLSCSRMSVSLAGNCKPAGREADTGRKFDRHHSTGKAEQ